MVSPAMTKPSNRRGVGDGALGLIVPSGKGIDTIGGGLTTNFGPVVPPIFGFGVGITAVAICGAVGGGGVAERACVAQAVSTSTNKTKEQGKVFMLGSSNPNIKLKFYGFSLSETTKTEKIFFSLSVASSTALKQSPPHSDKPLLMCVTPFHKAKKAYRTAIQVRTLYEFRKKVNPKGNSILR